MNLTRQLHGLTDPEIELLITSQLKESAEKVEYLGGGRLGGLQMAVQISTPEMELMPAEI